jgi:hypothetical protein
MCSTDDEQVVDRRMLEKPYAAGHRFSKSHCHWDGD